MKFLTWLENKNKELKKLKEKAKTRSPVPQTLTSRNRVHADASKYNRKRIPKPNFD